jgi:O-antigen/teichoic acid export membrane protein
VAGAAARRRSESPARRRVRPAGVGLAGWLLAAYVCLLPVQIRLAADFRPAPGDVLIAAYLVLRGGRLRWRARDWTSWHAAVLIALTVGAVVSQLQGEFDLASFGVKVGGLILLYATVLCILDFARTVEHLRWLLRVLCVWTAAHTLLFLVVLAVQQGQGATPMWPDINGGGTRLSGLLIDPNAFGGLVVVALVFVVYLPRRLALFSRWATLPIALVLATGLFYTFSRSAWIGLGMAVVTGLLVQPWRIGRLLAWSVPFVAAGSFIVAEYAWSFASVLIDRPESAAVRATIIDESVHDFMTSPVFGIGLNGAFARHDRIVHNTLVWFLTEFGLFGLLAIIGLLASYVVRALVARGRLPSALAPLPVALLLAHAAMVGVSTGIEALYQRHWWVVLAGISACYGWATATEPVPARSTAAARVRASTLARRPGPPAPVPAIPGPGAVSSRPGRVAPPSPPPSSNGRTEVLIPPAGPGAEQPSALDRGQPTVVDVPATPVPSAGSSAAPAAAVTANAAAAAAAAAAIAAPPAARSAAPAAPAAPAPAAADGVSGRLRSRLRANLRHEAVSHGSWGLMDQATSSGTNFLLSVVVASSVSAEDFGAFSFVTVLYLVAVGLWRSLNAEPFMIRYSARPEQLPGAAGRSLGSTWLAGVVGGVGCILAAELVPTPYQGPLQVLGVALPFLLVQDSARVVSFTMFRAVVAFINDAVWAVLLIVALVVLAILGGPHAPWLYLAAWAGTGAVAGLLILRQLRIVLDLGVASPDMRENFRLGVPLLANFLLTSAPPYLLFLITPAIAGLAELGLVRAAFVPFGPFGVLLQGMQLVALPWFMRLARPSDVARLSRHLSLGLAAVAALWGVLVAVVMPTALGTWLIGDLWEPTQSLRVLFAFAFVLDALSVGPLLALRALQAPRRLVWVRLLAGPPTLVLGLVLLPILGAEGVAMALIFGHVVTIAAAIVEVRRLVARRATERPTSPPVLLPGSAR